MLSDHFNELTKMITKSLSLPANQSSHDEVTQIDSLGHYALPEPCLGQLFYTNG
jgi:hypothetical protein